MSAKTFLAASLVLFAHPAALTAQTPAPNANANQNANPSNQNVEDKQEPNHFWQASVGGGHYMVALERITAISRHKYVLNGNVIVDEVTVDTVGQSLVRFYFLSPLTDATTGSALGNAASRIVDRGRELVEKTADTFGTNVQDMVQKNYPQTTHAHTVEYRVQSAQELGGLYNSVRTAWETGHGRRFTIKK